jgi:hypothetical protein
MREYIELEFSSALAGKQLSFTLDIERIIDDVVLFCMLVGNDFLPGRVLERGGVLVWVNVASTHRAWGRATRVWSDG